MIAARALPQLAVTAALVVPLVAMWPRPAPPRYSVATASGAAWSPPPVRCTAGRDRCPPPRTIEAALASAHDDLVGCFGDWNEREPGDADLRVRLTAGHDGIAHSSVALAGPRSPFLRLCVAVAIERARFPQGPDDIDLEVSVKWAAGRASVSHRVIARRRPVSDHVTDLRPRAASPEPHDREHDADRERALAKLRQLQADLRDGRTQMTCVLRR